MVQSSTIDYEAMIRRYMNEWQGKNLRGFYYEEKVNIYRIMKTMKKMGITPESTPQSQPASATLRDIVVEYLRWRCTCWLTLRFLT